ncbi:MAG: hypothetical protein CMJ64_05730, partial [Planctomycetaceae bacterium]|nr:hypothetical protein [Planctomycetaceae bacterium]
VSLSDSLASLNPRDHQFAQTPPRKIRWTNTGVPERMVMAWLGHANSEVIRHYYHLHDEDAQRRMNSLDFLGGTSGRSAGQAEGNVEKEDVEPPTTEKSDDVDDRD